VWWFSVVDVVQVLTQQADYQTARKYWNKLKERLVKAGSQSVTDCHRLKLPAADGKNYLTDVASAETLLRLVQSVPSSKAGPCRAEPIKLITGAYCVRRFWKKNEQFSDVDIR
jgi:DNA-damage-inducible protein D